MDCSIQTQLGFDVMVGMHLVQLIIPFPLLFYYVALTYCLYLVTGECLHHPMVTAGSAWQCTQILVCQVIPRTAWCREPSIF